MGKRILPIIALLALSHLLVAADNTIKKYEYWIDGQFDQRTEQVSAEFSSTLDMSALCEGIHSISFRAQDTNGRWGSPAMRYFLRFKQHAATTGNTAASYEYWLDGDYAKRKAINATDDGSLTTTLDVSALCAGIHTLSYRLSDKAGVWSSPTVKYFLCMNKTDYSGNVAKQYEYWLDGNYASKKVADANTDGSLTTTLDVSTLCAGIHTLSYRLSDKLGVWGAPAVKYFLCMNKTDYSGNVTKQYEYWIDGDYSKKQTGNLDSGNATLNLDMSALCKGAHTLSYRISDALGQWSAPAMKYFVITDKSLAGNNIVAYEYWFNHGSAVHVDVTPVNPFSLNGLVVDIKDVVANEIDDNYRFDVPSSTVYSNDSVSFGIRCIDALGNSSASVMSKKFFMEVPLKVDVTSLTNGEPYDFTAPQPGYVAAFATSANVGDSLIWTVERGTYTINFFDKDGNKLTPDDKYNVADSYRILSKGGITYALIHKASSGAMKNMAITCNCMTVNGINLAKAEGITFKASKNLLTIESSKENTISIYDVTSKFITTMKLEAGSISIPLPSNIYLLRVGSNVEKIMIP